MILTQDAMSYTSNQSGRHSRCFVCHLFPRHGHISEPLYLPVGEMLCFLPVLYEFIAKRWRAGSIRLPEEDSDSSLEDLSESQKLPPQKLTGRHILLLWLPALCDLTGTTLMNVGLLYTPVSIYQMTRGALVLFVGILSVVFLRRRLHLYQWLSLVTVMAGVSLVGLSGSLVKDTLRSTALSFVNMLDPTAPTTDIPADGTIEDAEAAKVVIGVFFILFAQIFTATQFVVEEKILGQYNIPPLLAVGYEGLFGTISVLLLLPLLPLIKLPPSSPAAAWFDLVRGWHQLVDTPSVLYSGVVIACSIALFNFFGLSVTKYVSATARSLTDTCRTLAIWIVSLALGWEILMWPISLLQVAGFGLLVYGTFLFNNLVQPPRFMRPSEVAILAPDAGMDDEDAALLSADALDETARLPADLGTSGYDVVPTETQGAVRNRSGN
jgi:drug/metabolite transporter (DMT)-like permease